MLVHDCRIGDEHVRENQVEWSKGIDEVHLESLLIHHLSGLLVHDGSEHPCVALVTGQHAIEVPPDRLRVHRGAVLKRCPLIKHNRPRLRVVGASDLFGEARKKLHRIALVPHECVVDGPLAPNDGVVAACVRVEIADVLATAKDEDVLIGLRGALPGERGSCRETGCCRGGSGELHKRAAIGCSGEACLDEGLQRCCGVHVLSSK